MTVRKASVFISYSHDPMPHPERVLEFANKLREIGVEAELDQYHMRPNQGWPKWCEEQLRPENSDFVLVLCTQPYMDRINGKVSADEGRGVFWEGELIYNYIYNAKDNSRFIPILLPGTSESLIPLPLQGSGHYSIQQFKLEDQEFKNLYRLLTDQPKVRKLPTGKVVNLKADDAEINVLNAVEALPAETSFNERYQLSSELNADEATARAIYLREMSQDIENRLAASIHNARFIELGIDDAPTAVHLPWRYVDTGEHREFAEIEEALEYFGHRALLLGAPGSGKTTTLLHLAQRMTKLASDNAKLPIPLIVNLSNLISNQQPQMVSPYPFYGGRM